MSVFKLFGEFAVRGLEEAEADIRSTTRVAENSFEDMADAADRAADGLERGFKRSDIALGSFVGNMASGLLERGLDAISGAVSTLVEVASESTEDLGKLSVAFDQTGWSAEAASSTYRAFVGLLGETDQSVEAANHLAELCSNEQELAQWTDIAAGVFAKFGDSLPLEGLTEAANETAKVGAVTGPLADALNWAGVAEDEFNQKLAACNTEQERAALITETLSAIYGEAGQAYRDTNAELVAYRESQAAANEAAANAGTAILPIVTLLQDFGTKLLVHATPALQDFSGFLLNEAVPAVQEFGGFITDTAIPALVNWSPVLVGAAVAIGGVAAVANAAAIATGVKTAAMAVSTTVTSGLAAAQGVLNAVMSANPIGIVIALLAGLAAALVVAWNTSEEFRAVVSAAWEWIKGAAESACAGIQSAWDSLVAFLSGLPDRIISFFSGVGEGIAGFFQDALDRASEIGQGIVDFFAGIPGQIVDAFTGLGNRIASAIGDILPSISWETVTAGSSSIQVPSISWFAQGGIVTDPTLGMIGEAGHDEAVVPLTAEGLRPFAQAMTEEMGRGGQVGGIGSLTKEDVSTAFLDAIAAAKDMLVVNLSVDGVTFATAVASATDQVNGSRQILVDRGLVLG